MWIPKDEAEIAARIEQGDLFETPTFDAKEALPGKSKEIAKDLAAMANDGGVILVGVGEDANKRLARLAPIPLKDQGLRVESIAYSALQERVPLRVKEIPHRADPTQGYLVVIVPMSLRAPHMVTVEQVNRYYGRNGTQSVPLTEGEVARLYARRVQAEQSAAQRIEALLDGVELASDPEIATLRLAVQPLLTSTTFLEMTRQEASVLFEPALTHAVRQKIPGGSDSGLHIAKAWHAQPYGWLQHFGADPAWEPTRQTARVRDMTVRWDGGGTLVIGRVGDRVREGAPIWLFESQIAAATLQFVAFFGKLYEEVGYLGPVALGVEVCNIKGAVSHLAEHYGTEVRPLTVASHRWQTQCLAWQLQEEPREVAARLVWNLIQSFSPLTRERLFGE